MTVCDFRDSLLSAIATASMPVDISNESAFEKQFLTPLVLQVSDQYPGVHAYTHPWNNKTHCEPDCETAPNSGRVVTGCPRCWAASKKWASVLAFGTHHTFDVVAKDMSGRSLAVEAKLIGPKGGHMPNGEIQRFLGQCSLAKTKHDFVIGVCGLKGNLNPKWKDDTEVVKDWFTRVGVEIVFRSTG